MWAVLGPARPEEGTTCFRAGLGLYFYSLGWHDTARNFFGPSRPDPFWPEARWAWAVPARPGPILSTTPTGGWFWRAPREGETEAAAVARPGLFSRLRPPVARVGRKWQSGSTAGGRRCLVWAYTEGSPAPMPGPYPIPMTSSLGLGLAPVTSSL